LQHICKPTQADPQTKGLQKSCNFADAHSAVNNFLTTNQKFIFRIQSIFVILTKRFKTKRFKMDNFGDTIRKLREEKELPLRTVAAYLDIDQAILSKTERGQRKATREQIVKLAEFFKVKEDDLLIAWLSDKLVYEVADEQIALKALQVAEEKVKYINKNKKI
jgi:transcriptional regulator with XRE-family HTH domain